MTDPQRPRFVLIDHTIVDIGGHYYQYAVHVLEAAKDAGYDPILVTNRAFRSKDETIPWPVFRIYRDTFWGARAPAGWRGAIVRLLVAAKRRKEHARIQLMYSRLMCGWRMRNDLSAYARSMPADQRFRFRSIVYFCAAHSLAVAAAGARVLVAAVPFKSYLRGVYASVRNFARVVTVPIRLVFNGRHWLQTSREAARRIRRFGRDTERLASAIHPRSTDIIFIPTLSDLEMLGVVRASTMRPELRQAHWNLLFRRDAFLGEDDGSAELSEAQQSLRNALLECQARLGENVAFTTDTDQLKDQYDRLVPDTFHALPIPHTQAPSGARRNPDDPVQLVYIGDARTEKGYHHLPGVVQDLWPDYCETGRARFVLQSNYNVPQGEPKPIVARSQLELFPEPQVRLILQPLGSEDYWKTLQSSHVALLPYDAERYPARSSGILAESLSAGIPVAVPAGTWMSNQFIDHVYRYRASLREEMQIVAEHDWAGASLVPDTACECTIPVPAGPPGDRHYALVTLDSATSERRAIELSIDQFDLHGFALIRQTMQLERGPESERRRALLPIHEDARNLLLTVTGRGSSTLRFIGAKVEILNDPERRASVPTCAVGGIFASPDELSRLLREMIEHNDHYEATAREFAPRFRDRHNAARLVREIGELAGVPPAGGSLPVGSVLGDDLRARISSKKPRPICGEDGR